MSFLKTRFIRVCAFVFFLLSVVNQAKAQTTLVAGDIAFTGYSSNNTTNDEFSFVLLVPVTSGTVINFTDNGWLNGTNPTGFRSGEGTLTWTATSALVAGTEIKMNFPQGGASGTATLVGGGSAGSVTVPGGVAPSLSTGGDQVLAYQGTIASPTFISAIHMNVYTTVVGDPVTTTAATWDPSGGGPPAGGGTTNGSALPPGLTTGVNAIWIGTQDVSASEFDNSHFNNCALPIATAAQARAALNNQANWASDNNAPSTFPLPTGCNYLGALSSPPSFTTNPSNATVCEGGNTSFTIVATGAVTYQWQVDNGGGFANISNNATYSGATATTLNVTGVTNSMNGYLYRCVATNGSGSTNSNNATLTVTALPVNPTLLAKTPNTPTVADGTPVSATFNAGTGGSGGCTDDFRYTTNGGASYLPYTPGSNISTTGVAAGSGFVFIEGRRAGCASCSNSYVVLASWVVTPLPAGATTLAAGDIGFSGYNSDPVTDEFSFVLLKNIGPGTVINFTDNGYQSGALTNVEQTVTWTSNAAYSAGTEIRITGLTATLASGGSAGTVTGSALSLITGGDQVLAYQGSAASPTFISGIHMNVFSTTIGDAVSTTAAAWDGAMTGTSASALPPGLTTGVNCIWIGTQDVPSSEVDNARYGICSDPRTLGPIATLRAALNNQANWTKDDINPVVLPTGCPYLGVGITPPTINTNPSNTAVCETAPASFSITATNALTYQWQEDQGGGFNNLSNTGVYSGVTTTTLNISAAALSMNGYTYRCVASNGGGSTNSTAATLTVNALPVSPSLLAKTPSTITVADGTTVSATFNAGSGGTGCADDFRYTTDGGTTYLPYTPGSNISTTGIAAGSGFVFIEGRRANCSAGCQGVYTVLAMWRVTPLPAAATTLNAGDIAFSAYASTSTPDAFSFVLLRNIGPGTVINFTDNGFQAGVLTSAEQTVTWTAPAGGLPGGTEITISGTTASRSGGGSAGTVTGVALSLSTSGDQVLAYRGTAASPTFISAIHMNVYSTLIGDPVTTTAAAWDGTATGLNASALPTGLTTGVNCIWIGTQDVSTSEHDNAKYGNCTSPVINGSLVALRAALNNQANWIVDDNTPPSFTQPTGCNYLLAICPAITVTNPATATGTAGIAFSQTFTAGGGTGPYTFTTASALPAGLSLSTGGVLSGTPTVSGTFPITVTATDINGCSGNGSVYSLVIACPTITVTNPAITSGFANAPFSQTFTASGGIAPYTFTTASSLPAGLTLSAAGILSGTPTATGSFPIVVTATDAAGCTGTGTTYTLVINTNLCGGAQVSQLGTSQSVWQSNTITGFTIPAGTNRLLVVTASDAAAINVAGVTFGGTPMIKQAQESDNLIAVDAIYTLTLGSSGSPSSGNIVVSGGSTDKFISATVFQNVNQVTPVSGQDSLQNNGVGTPAPLFNTLTINSAANDLAFDIFDYFKISTGSNTASAVPPGQTLIVSQGPLSITSLGFGYYSTSRRNGAAPNVAMNRTTTSLDAWIHVALNIKSAATAIAVTNPGVTTGTVGTPFSQTFTASGGTGSYTFTTFSALPAGLTLSPGGVLSGTPTAPGSFPITVSATDANGCFGTGAIYTLVISCPPLTVNAPTVTQPTCAVPTGTIVVNATGSGTLEYSLNAGPFQLSNSFSGLTPGNYNISVRIQSSPACTANYSGNPVVINAVPVAPTVNAPAVTQPTCAVPTGTIVVNATGSGTLEYSLNAGPFQLSNTFSGLAAGNYNISVRLQSSPTCVTNYSGNPVIIIAATGCCVPSTITCPGNISQNNTPGQCGRTVSYTVTTTGTPPLTITYTFTGATTASGSGDGSGSTFNVGTTNVTLTITNACGNSSCSFTVTITDNQPPNVTAGTISSCYPTVAAAEAAAIAATTATDNCPGTITKNASTVGTCSAVITVTATDANSNTASVTYNTRIDNTPPTVTVGTISSCYPSVASAEAAALAATSATDNCPGALTETASTVGTCSAVVTVTTTDGCGNATAVTYNTRIDNTPPTVTVGTISSCYPSVASAEAAALAATSATDNCPGALTETASTVGTCSAVVTVTTTDGCGNATAVTYNTRIDNTPPVITCPAPVTVSCVSAVPAPNIGSVTATDNCPGALTITHQGDVISNQTCVNRYTITRTYRATDGCGNFAECTQIITVNDQTPPVLTCPAAVTVQCQGDVPPVDIASVTGVSDNCGGPVTVTWRGDVISNQTCIHRYTITRTYRATDVCGNFAECTQIITVNDQTPPTLTCPPAVTVSCASAVPVPDVNTVTGVSDNCGTVGSPVVVTYQGDVISNQTCANRYTITRTYRATDACGNFAECTQIITVNDQTPPVLTCPAPVTVSCVSEVPVPNPGLVTGVSDNCGGAVTVTFVSDVISNQTCANRYTITRTYRATDVCGNFAECTQIITVYDQTPPVVTCPAPVTVSCASAVPAPNIASVTATDNCGGAITITFISDVISNQTCANRYTITRTYRATDACGNFAECTQIITVNDQTPPVLTCPAPVTVSCASAVPAPNPGLVTGVSDNCGGAVTVIFVGDVISNQTCANRYTITRTYRATDVCGNSAECTQTITVNDQTPPVLTCPAPITVSCASAVPAPNTSLVTGVSDNCGGPVTVTFVSDVISNQTCANRYTITRTYRATDVCGNFANCTQIITVNDQTPPVLTCPAPLTVSCVSEVPAPNPGLVTGVSDNCGGPVTVTFVSDVISNQTCANRYTITRTYRATDVCGNFAQCTQIITVNDQTGPVMSCPTNITVNTPAGSCTAVVNFTVTATDNCGGAVTIVSVPASGSAFPIGNTVVTSTATDVCGNVSTCTFVVIVRDGQLPVITQQPANVRVCTGDNATFSVAAITSPNAGGPLSYQWQVSTNGASSFSNIPGATSSTLTLNNVTFSMNANFYRVVVTGLCTTVISDHALLTVHPLPTIVLSALPFASILPPQSTSILAQVNPQGGTYSWTYNGSPLPSATSYTVPNINIDRIGAYQLVYRDPNGCRNTSSVLNIIATPSTQLWVYPNPNKGSFNVRYYNPTGEQVTVKVFGPLGQQMFEKKLTLGVAYTNIPINLGRPSPGVYTVRVFGASNVLITEKKVVVFLE